MSLPDPVNLGYACLNTILRAQKPPVFCSRTARIATIKEKGLDYVKGLGLQNLQDLEKIILWNEEYGIKFMRMSSDMFPFASHKEYGYSLKYCKDELERIGEVAKKLGHRLTTHPGQTNNLGSPTEEVVQATIRDLSYHAEMMDLMGLDCNSVMIIHMGGVYGNKDETIERFRKRFKELPQNVRDRLVLENDEVCYNTQELLPICESEKIPLVFDWHHHRLNPGTLELDEMLKRIEKIWKDRGIRQKMHYSESRPECENGNLMQRRAHSDYVQSLPPCGKVDLMIEAKMKEQALLYITEKLL